jgi:hypothetical protein
MCQSFCASGHCPYAKKREPPSGAYLRGARPLGSQSEVRIYCRTLLQRAAFSVRSRIKEHGPRHRTPAAKFKSGCKGRAGLIDTGKCQG